MLIDIRVIDLVVSMCLGDNRNVEFSSFVCIVINVYRTMIVIVRV